jgi:dTDP-4-dehydrorhamnose reductase
MKVVTVGNGFIANHLPYEIANYRITPNEDDMLELIDQYKPDVIVNATGFCGKPNIDQCELERTKTYMSNVVIPLMIAEQCERHNIHLIHIGSGSIFFGKSPNIIYEDVDPGNPSLGTIDYDSGWKEDDFANPQSFYSKTKYSCDLALGSMNNVTTLRIRMPISDKNNNRNLINKLKGYNSIIDIKNSVTFVNDLVRCIDWAAKNTKNGIYHVVNPEPLTAVDIIKEYQKYVPDHKYNIISEKELDKITFAKRSNCILNGDKLSKAGFKMTSSRESLIDCMLKYSKNI